MISVVVKDTSRPSRSSLVSRNVTLRKVPNNCRVYAFVIRQSKVDDKIKEELVQFGEESGLNLFVGLWDMKDQDYFKLNKMFKLGKLPAIIMTAESSLSTVSDTENTFVRIDDKRLFSKPEELSELVNELYSLFMDGQVIKAIKKTKRKEISIFLTNLLVEIKNVVTKIAREIMDKYNIKFEFGNFKIDLTKPSSE